MYLLLVQVRAVCVSFFSECIQFASLLFLSGQVKHLNKVSPQNFAFVSMQFLRIKEKLKGYVTTPAFQFMTKLFIIHARAKAIRC